jgi:hypothetical protein
MMILVTENRVCSMFDRVEQVKDFSRSGHSVPETNRKDIRELIIANYRIIYRIETHAVSILASGIPARFFRMKTLTMPGSKNRTEQGMEVR